MVKKETKKEITKAKKTNFSQSLMFLMAYINSSKLGRRTRFLIKWILIYLMTRVAIVDATNKMPKIIV